MSDLQKYIEKQLEDPEFKQAWEETELEFNIAKAIIQRRKELGLSQKDIAEKLNTKQSAISRIESGQNLTISMLHKLAKALNMEVELKLVPTVKNALDGKQI
ncbi:helix-turn-helix domain-containing protein [Zhaonella formicivorans]|jgi:transcriptional regulator with XRE-family HTH domain|uniref:helix-turn-helix domain-containing protein n=1 Tax=Zhaonella formicivorans TaxID=2528593 RepID=UPI0010F39797|nr:helix-turn-helix transcriptional regulator [Zhaonella formicivorans]